MLEPHSPFSEWVLAVVFFAFILLLSVRSASKDQREYQRFKRYRSTGPRQKMYRKWLLGSFISFGGLSALLLVLVWQYVPLLQFVVDGWDWVRHARSWYASLGPLSIALTVVLALLVTVVPILLLFVARNRGEDVTAIGDIHAMLPRNYAEMRLGALLSLNAGVVEELLFRLALPAVVFGAFGNAFFALIVSAIVFGALHRYQGVVGVLGTTLVGLFLLAIYFATGSILAAIVVHVLIDLRSFVFIPLIVMGVRR